MKIVSREIEYKMKILFVSTSVLYYEKRPFGRGGTDSQEYGIAVEMARRGHDAYILGHFAETGWRDYDVLVNGIQFINVRALYLRDKFIGETVSAFLLSKKVANEIEKIKPDIINLTGRFTAYFPSKLNIPKVFITHHPDAFDFYKEFSVKNNRLNYFYSPFKKIVEESVMRHSDVLIALNKDIRDYLHGKGFMNVCVIPNAVDVAKSTNKRDDNFILYAGGFRKVKGIDYLIEAFSGICDDHSTDLLLIGSGPDEERLKKIVASKNLNDRVHFIPMVGKDKLREYLSKCSVFVLPSLFETFGIVTIEAMASGKPVIASDIPGPQDVITQGYDGFLFEKGNVDELKKYLELCLSDEKLRRNMGKNARRTVEERYTFHKIAEDYLKVYSEILHNE